MLLLHLDPPLILASSSPARAQLLRQAGIAFEARPAILDEEAVKQAGRHEGLNASVVAENLAWLKAVTISRRHPGRLVIGGDQMMESAGIWYDKPGNLARARQQLLALAGREQTLYSAVMVVKDGVRLWHQVVESRLSMLPLAPAEIEAYLQQAGEEVWHSVGAVHYEGLGLQLFDQVRGDYFAILGLPLLPLMGYLRQYYGGLVDGGLVDGGLVDDNLAHDNLAYDNLAAAKPERG
ncbi:MAG: nucleoside triphosphate pyrophosphatase [Candidatus Symbiobacter sp.]|nr:nucleoside triphosphate pyrophosphatase [Candidatus Symbiobacter sp.]